MTGQATQDDSIKSALNQTSKLQSEMAACMALASASAEQMKSLQGSLDKLDAAGELCNGLRNVPLDTSRLCVLVTLLLYLRYSRFMILFDQLPLPSVDFTCLST